jgi:LytTr DNA-binding domain
MVAAWARVLLAAAVVAGILAVSGGFGTGALAIVPRLAYWLGLVAVGAALAILVSRLVVPPPWLEARSWPAAALIIVCVALPMTGIVAASSALVSHRALRWPILAGAFLPTLATTAGITALAFLLRQRLPSETHAAPRGAPPAKFLDRLPQNLQGAAVWAVEAQDHYLRIHTDRGQDLILMRLTDAIAELEGIEGARTHRSWWVARDAVAAVERGEGRATLTLPDGTRAPVSRAWAKALRSAGWF